MKKTLFLLIILFVLLIVSGCTNDTINTDEVFELETSVMYAQEEYEVYENHSLIDKQRIAFYNSKKEEGYIAFYHIYYFYAGMGVAPNYTCPISYGTRKLSSINYLTKMIDDYAFIELSKEDEEKIMKYYLGTKCTFISQVISKEELIKTFANLYKIKNRCVEIYKGYNTWDMEYIDRFLKGNSNFNKKLKLVDPITLEEYELLFQDIIKEIYMEAIK